MITKWNFQTPTEEELHKRDRLASQLGLSPVVCLLLVQRGLTTVEEVKKFFKPSLNDLHDPFLMPDMEKAVKRLNKALGNKEKILIYGDYDVDGTTAVSLVYKYLRPYSSALDYYIPDRYDEGYGISYKGINYARENGITLVISLDCGIKAIEKIEYAKQLGIDFIICDHHMPDDTLPDAVAVLDAKRVDSVYPYEHLSGCGVGFKFMQAFAKSNNFPFADLEKLLELTAVSIASDIVPITGENRILAIEQQPQPRAERDHRYLRPVGQRDHDQRHRLQDRTSHQRFRPYDERKGSGRTAPGEGCRRGPRKEREHQPI